MAGSGLQLAGALQALDALLAQRKADALVAEKQRMAQEQQTATIKNQTELRRLQERQQNLQESQRGDTLGELARQHDITQAGNIAQSAMPGDVPDQMAIDLLKRTGYSGMLRTTPRTVEGIPQMTGLIGAGAQPAVDTTLRGSSNDLTARTAAEERAAAATQAQNAAAERNRESIASREAIAAEGRANRAAAPRYHIQPIYDAQGRPVGAFKMDERTGQIEPVDVGQLGGQLKPPPGTLTNQTIQNESALDALDRLKTLFDQSGAEGGPLEGRIRSAGQAIGIAPSEGFANFKAASSAFKNSVIKAITGAQMSEPEARRITEQIPTELDTPVVWKAKYAQTQANLRDLENRLRQDRGQGTTTPTSAPTARIRRYNPTTGKVE